MKTNSSALLLIIMNVAFITLIATASREATFFVVVIRVCSPMAFLASVYLFYKKIRQ